MEHKMNNEDHEQCVENITNENYQDLVSRMIHSEIVALEQLNLNQNELLYRAAEAIAYLKLSDTFVNKLAAHHANCAINHVNESPLSDQNKENITSEIINAHRLDIAEIRTNRNKEIAKNGGKGKAKKDKDGKQNARRDVKEWWEKWQQDPSLYDSQAAFALAMLDKHDGILKSTKVIERWCTEWKKQKIKILISQELNNDSIYP
jgi:hypothetical protein